MSLPYLNISNADIYESIPHKFLGKYSSLSHLVPLSFMKIRIYGDVRDLSYFHSVFIKGTSLKNPDNCFIKKLGGKLLILGHIKEFLRGRLVPDKNKVKSYGDIFKFKDHIYKQIQETFKSINNNNKRVLPAFLNPQPLLNNGPPSSYGHGSAEEAYLVVQRMVTLWN